MRQAAKYWKFVPDHRLKALNEPWPGFIGGGLYCQMCVSAMALKPFVFHLHRYCWNVLLLALASALLSLCGCVCVQGRDVHTLLEEFPVFEVHPQTACIITNSFFSLLLSLAAVRYSKNGQTSRRKVEGGKKSDWIRSSSHRCCSPMVGVESPKPCLANNTFCQLYMLLQR